MKKTVTVNLGGFVFHIDEDAYEKLQSYLHAVKKSIGNDESSDEIMNDIESRIAELFSEKANAQYGVVTVSEVNRIIQIMGEPAVYQTEEGAQNESKSAAHETNTDKTHKKLYRDTDNSVLGGVLSGLGHYFGIDPIWLRIIFAVLFFYFGTGILLYIILWVIMPAAKTTAEKLEMRQEPVNVQTIINTAEEGFENVKRQGRKYAPAVNTLARRLLGAIFMIIGCVGLLAALLTPLAVSQINYITLNNYQVAEILYGQFPKWSILLSLFFIVFIPACSFILFSIKLLYKNVINTKWLSFVFSIIWFLSLGYFVFAMIKTNHDDDQLLDQIFKNNYTIETTITGISLNNSEVLKVDFINDPRLNYINKTIESNADKYKANRNVKLYLVESHSDSLYYEVETYHFSNAEAEINFRGKSKTVELTQVPHTLDYFNEVTNNQLVLSNSFLETSVDDDIIENKVRIKLYVPANKKIEIDSKHIQHIENKKAIENGSHIYQFQNQQLKCTNC